MKGKEFSASMREIESLMERNEREQMMVLYLSRRKLRGVQI